MSNYLATTSSEEYSGKMCGIQFKKGRAMVNEYTIDESLGRSVEETVRMLTKDFGVEVKRVTRDIEVEDLGVEAELEPAPAAPAPKVGKRGGRRKAASPAVAYGPQEGV